jgi:hypothetical protein
MRLPDVRLGGRPAMSCGLTCRRYFLPVGFFVVDEAWLPMPEG